MLSAQAVTPHWATGAQESVELTTYRAASATLTTESPSHPKVSERQ